MSLAQAAMLGLVEGITEYLPVSSTGHLLLAQRALNIPQDAAADAYAICIQAGAIIAVLGLYFRYLKSMLMGLGGADDDGRRLAVNTFMAFLPAAAAGYLALDWVKAHLFGPWPIVIAWFVGGVAILAVSRSRTARPASAGYTLESLTWQRAFLIGLLQCLAIWPGTSRSLVTIVGGVLVGLKLRDAVIFSFILGAITLTAGTAYELLRHGPEMAHSYGTAGLLTGFVVAAVSAALAVKWMVGYLKRHGLQVFGYYRVAIALLVGVLLLTGRMEP